MKSSKRSLRAISPAMEAVFTLLISGISISWKSSHTKRILILFVIKRSVKLLIHVIKHLPQFFQVIPANGLYTPEGAGQRVDGRLSPKIKH